MLKRDSERCCNRCITAVLLLYDSMTLKGVHRGEHAPVRASHALWSRRGCALRQALHVEGARWGGRCMLITCSRPSRRWPRTEFDQDWSTPKGVSR